MRHAHDAVVVGSIGGVHVERAGKRIAPAQNQRARAALGKTICACKRQGERRRVGDDNAGRSGIIIQRQHAPAGIGDNPILRAARIAKFQCANVPRSVECHGAVGGDVQLTKIGGVADAVGHDAINPVTGGAPVAVGIYSPCRDPDESGHRGRYAVRAGERERGSGGVSAPRNLRGEVGSLQRIFCREPTA